MSLVGGGRFYVATRSQNNLAPDEYWQAQLLGNALSYTVDLSKVGCSCNAAFYFVNMPGWNSTGRRPDPTAGGAFSHVIMGSTRLIGGIHYFV